ncbi:hypothetical protein SUGI_1057860 [Cryptomeria japonica]|uniref:uncharacterized protein LOC131060828 isoform X2 n=1 Tax=Cryptomeria japonica TaxID=3369 RepID=UPI00241488B1|nr:uncharacterized protein LOC131060828 isoform X2 [Cryptomeria japonica]GLJ49805.1 hypothetical protein SUGI_1057860 [Cryptomeria japonica]
MYAAIGVYCTRFHGCCSQIAPNGKGVSLLAFKADFLFHGGMLVSSSKTIALHSPHLALSETKADSVFAGRSEDKGSTEPEASLVLLNKFLLASVHKRGLHGLGLDVKQGVVPCFNGFALDVFQTKKTIQLYRSLERQNHCKGT